MTQPIAQNLTLIRERLAAACRAAGRDPAHVRLLAVSKTFDVDALRTAVSLGLREFGESYVQEALPKMEALRAEGPIWHFIGPVQSNKTRDIAMHFDWVQSVDREKIARRLSEQRPDSHPPLEVCVQVNISGEASKSGVAPEAALALCGAVAAMPRLRLRGLMAIPAPLRPGQDPRPPFARLRRLFESVRAELGAPAQFDTLSAGMSEDFEAAILEGSTLVRLGSALFGSRQYMP